MRRSVVVIDAIRLALEAGADDAAKVAVIEQLIAVAPDDPPLGNESVDALIEAIKASRAQFVLTTPPAWSREEPSS